MKKTAAVIRSGLIWGVGLTVFGLGCLFILLVGIFYRGPFFERLIKFVCWISIAVCGIRVRRRGLENISPGKQYLLMMNHVNLLDGLVFYGNFPGWARGIEEESHFRWPLYGAVVRRMGQIPVNRRSGRKALQSLARAAALIRQRPDFSFMVLPEGTRTLNGKLGGFKRGGFLLALEAGLDILPLIQVGAFAINNKNSRLIRPGTIDFVVEKPVSIAGTTRDNLAGLMQKVRDTYLRYLD